MGESGCYLVTGTAQSPCAPKISSLARMLHHDARTNTAVDPCKRLARSCSLRLTLVTVSRTRFLLGRAQTHFTAALNAMRAEDVSLDESRDDDI